MTYVESRRVELTEEVDGGFTSYRPARDWITWTASFRDAPLFPRSKGSVTMSRSADTAEAAVGALKAAVEEQGWEWREE